MRNRKGRPGGGERRLRRHPAGPEDRKLVVAHMDAAEIKEAAVKEGMKTLLADGAEKALSGMTTIEEILRVSGSMQ